MTDKELFLSYYKKQNTDLKIKVYNKILILLQIAFIVKIIVLEKNI